MLCCYIQPPTSPTAWFTSLRSSGGSPFLSLFNCYTLCNKILMLTMQLAGPQTVLRVAQECKQPWLARFASFGGALTYAH